MQSSQKKQFIEIGGKSIIEHSIDKFFYHKEIDEIVIVLPQNNLDEISALLTNKYNHKLKFCCGGTHRQASVYNGLLSCADDCQLVLIHDGVRPFIKADEISQLIKIAKQENAAVPVSPVTNTLKTIKNGYISHTIDRSNVVNIFTPQVFDYQLIMKVHRQANDKNLNFTDDAALLEHYGYRVKVVTCADTNIKITTPADIKLANALLKGDEMPIITAIGQDSHRFDETGAKPLILAGIEIPNTPGLLANSDGDVVLHAITNAISGITGINILGEIADKLCQAEKMCDSTCYLAEALKYMENKKIVHVSISIEAKRPHLAKYMPTMRNKLAELLGITPATIGLTATTGEGLTECGKGLGISVITIINVKSGG